MSHQTDLNCFPSDFASYSTNNVPAKESTILHFYKK